MLISVILINNIKMNNAVSLFYMHSVNAGSKKTKHKNNTIQWIRSGAVGTAYSPTFIQHGEK
jgi:hypothetical protein